MRLYLVIPGWSLSSAAIRISSLRLPGPSGVVPQAAASRDYLEKIVQTTYRMPAPDETQMGLLVDYYAGLSRTVTLFTGSARHIVVQGTGRNPRRVKRLINSFILECQLHQSLAEFGADILVIISEQGPIGTYRRPFGQIDLLASQPPPVITRQRGRWFPVSAQAPDPLAAMRRRRPHGETSRRS
jgi:hypothetical protein